MTRLKQHPAVSTGRQRVSHSNRESAGCYQKLLAGFFEEAEAGGFLPRTQSIGIVSCSPGEGTSTIARNLATCAAAAPGCRVLLVDANVANPTVYRLFKVEASPGLAELFSGEADPVVCVQPSDADNLALITAGTSTRRWWRRRRSAARASVLIDELKREFSLIVVDLPAVAEPGGGLRLASMLDAVFLVVEAGRTRVQDARRAKKLLTEAGVHVCGVAVNKDPHASPRRSSGNGER